MERVPTTIYSLRRVWKSCHALSHGRLRSIGTDSGAQNTHARRQDFVRWTDDFFLTVCTKDRKPWLTQPVVQKSLEEIWRNTDAWLVGDYLLMPDHLHLFCAPRDLKFTIEKWIAFWKSQFSRKHLDEDWEWQRKGFHHRLRDAQEYSEKWLYVRENPIRKNLVKNMDDWKFRGTVHPYVGRDAFHRVPD